MRTPRKFGAIALVASLSLAMGACGGGDSDKEEVSADGTVEISVLPWKAETVQHLADKFMAANPKIKITVMEASPDGPTYAKTLQTRIAGNQQPDIFNFVAENRAEILDNDLAMDLTGQPVVDTVDPSWLDLYRKGEGVYGMSFSAWMGGIVYNKDILAKAGYDEFPTTWDEFLTMGQKINDSGTPAYYEEQQITSGSLTALLASSYKASGVDSVDWVLDARPAGQSFGEAWTPVLAEWAKAVETGVMPANTIGLKADQITSAFLNGEVAMYRSGTWAKADLDESGINYGFAAFPAFGDGETFINGGPEPAYAVAANTSEAKQEAALKFLEYIGSAEGVETQVTEAGSMSISDAYTTDPGEAFRAAYDANLQKGLKYWIEWSKGSTPMTATIVAEQQKLFQGEGSAEEFSAALDDSWNKL